MIGLVAVLFLSSCRTPAATRTAPVLRLSADDVGAKGGTCSGELDQRRGQRPPASRVIAVLRAESDRPVSLEAFEQLFEVAARRRCADGVAVLRATADDGANGYLDATAEVWSSTPAPAVVTPAT